MFSKASVAVKWLGLGLLLDAVSLAPAPSSAGILDASTTSGSTTRRCTTYHYRVKSKDAARNLAMSGDRTFTTAAAPTVRNKKNGGVWNEIVNFFKHLF